MSAKCQLEQHCKERAVSRISWPIRTKARPGPLEKTTTDVCKTHLARVQEYMDSLGGTRAWLEALVIEDIGSDGGQ